MIICKLFSEIGQFGLDVQIGYEITLQVLSGKTNLNIILKIKRRNISKTYKGSFHLRYWKLRFRLSFSSKKKTL